jgi:succinate dehydrogenase hydrophobic anchor subunit
LNQNLKYSALLKISSFMTNKLKIKNLFRPINCFKTVLFPVFLFLFCFSTVHATIIDYKLEMPLLSGQENVTSLNQYLKMIFVYGLGMVGVAALFAIIYSGVRYLAAGSSDTRRSESKKGIWAAITGVILLIFSFLILNTINPQLTSWQEPDVKQIDISTTQNTGSANSPYQMEMPLSSNSSPQNPGQYVRTFFIYGLGLVALAALFGIVFGGFNYFLSGGNQTLKTYGRKWMIAAISGLALLLCSYLILNTINPQLTSFNLKNPDAVSIGGNSSPPGSSNLPYQVEMPLGNQNSSNDLGKYIRTVFIFGLGLVTLAALFALIFGGINYILSAGSSSRQTTAKQWIWGAVSGLALLICSYLILATINPQLTSFNLKLDPISISGGGNSQTSGTASEPYKLEMPIGGSNQAKTPGEYTRLFFIYGLGLAALAALGAFVFGGLNYVVSGPSGKTEGKNWIISAASGLALLLCSFLILNTINPQLISFQNPKLDTIEIPPHIGLNYDNFSALPNMSAVQSNDPIFQNSTVMSALQGAAAKYGVPLNVAMFVAGIEHDPNNPYGGTSSKGARGVMQLMPGTAKLMGVTDITDPTQNIYGGVKYLAEQYKTFGNWPDALAGYNAGPGNVKKYGGGANVPFPETKKYLQAARAKGVI